MFTISSFCYRGLFPRSASLCCFRAPCPSTIWTHRSWSILKQIHFYKTTYLFYSFSIIFVHYDYVRHVSPQITTANPSYNWFANIYTVLLGMTKNGLSFTHRWWIVRCCMTLGSRLLWKVNKTITAEDDSTELKQTLHSKIDVSRSAVLIYVKYRDERVSGNLLSGWLVRHLSIVNHIQQKQFYMETVDVIQGNREILNFVEKSSKGITKQGGLGLGVL